MDSKRKTLEERVSSTGGNDELQNATLLEHFLANENLTIEEIYTNMTELLLSGVDTVSRLTKLYFLYKYIFIIQHLT